MLQLLAPFALGQLTHRWVGDWVRAHRKLLGFEERGSIVSVAYLAFSDAVVGGIWNQLQMRDLLGMLITVAALLAAVLFLTRFVGRNLGFSREGQIAIMFCGSKKGMGSGLPMANM